MLGGEPQLPEPSEGVLQRPGMHDLAVAEAEDPDLIDALEAAPSRSLAKPCSQVGGRAGEPPDDLVALSDQLQVAAVEDLVDEPAHDCFVGLGHRGPPDLAPSDFAGIPAGSAGVRPAWLAGCTPACPWVASG